MTAALGGAQEIVRDTCGLLIEPCNAEMLAASLRRLIEDPELRRKLGQYGPGRALELCEPAVQLKNTAAFLVKN